MFPIFFTLTSDRRHSVWELNAIRFPPRAMHEMLNGWLAIFMHHGEILFMLPSFCALCCFSVFAQKHFFWVAQRGNWVLDPTNPEWQLDSRPVAPWQWQLGHRQFSNLDCHITEPPFSGQSISMHEPMNSVYSDCSPSTWSRWGPVDCAILLYQFVSTSSVFLDLFSLSIIDCMMCEISLVE